MRGGKRTIKSFNNHQVKGRLCTHYLVVDDTYGRPKATFPGDIAELPIAKGLGEEENMKSVVPEPNVEEIDGS